MLIQASPCLALEVNETLCHDVSTVTSNAVNTILDKPDVLSWTGNIGWDVKSFTYDLNKG
jgi:hypothetical protein